MMGHVLPKMICHGMLKNVLLPVGQFYSNFGLKTAESAIQRPTSQIFCKFYTIMEFYFIGNYFIFCRTYFIGNNLIENMPFVLPFEWLQQTLTLQLCSFFQIQHAYTGMYTPSQCLKFQTSVVPRVFLDIRVHISNVYLSGTAEGSPL